MYGQRKKAWGPCWFSPRSPIGERSEVTCVRYNKNTVWQPNTEYRGPPATHGLLHPHMSCLSKHSYTWGKASPHRRKRVQKDDGSSQANKERKTTNTRPHHFTNKLVFSASCAHFYKVQLRFQRQKCWSYQEHRVTLLWTERKKRLFSIGLVIKPALGKVTAH